MRFVVTIKNLLLMRGAWSLGKFSYGFFPALVLHLLITSSTIAQTSLTPMPQISQTPAKYRYPSLICGKPLPVPTATVWNKLTDLYKDCIASNCNQPDKYSATTVKNIAAVVFQEPVEFIEQYEDTQPGYTIFCAFFGGNSLNYVNCNYILSTVESTYEVDTCRIGNIEAGYTPVFGPNKATFVIEKRIVPVSEIPSLLEQYQARGQAFVEQSYVQRLLFTPHARIPGLIDGPIKLQMLQNLNCESATATQSHTLKQMNIESTTQSATLTPAEDISATQLLSSSNSATCESASATVSTTPDNIASASQTKPLPETPSKSLDISRTLSTELMATNTISIMNYMSCYNSKGVITQAATGVKPHTSLSTRNVQSLCWELGRKGSTTMVWNAAKNYCTSKGAGWYLPTIYELYALYLQKSALGSDFDTNRFWSESSDGGVLAWRVGFSEGYVAYSGHGALHKVRCCRVP